MINSAQNDKILPELEIQPRMSKLSNDEDIHERPNESKITKWTFSPMLGVLSRMTKSTQNDKTSSDEIIVTE